MITNHTPRKRKKYTTPIVLTKAALQQQIKQASPSEREMLITDAVSALYVRHTEREKEVGSAIHLNDLGFDRPDAPTGLRDGRNLRAHGTTPSINYWTRVDVNGWYKLCKYHKQLNEVAYAKMKQLPQLTA
jgi:hypothetical protein